MSDAECDGVAEMSTDEIEKIKMVNYMRTIDYGRVHMQQFYPTYRPLIQHLSGLYVQIEDIANYVHCQKKGPGA
jgi:hypothetical protein